MDITRVYTTQSGDSRFEDTKLAVPRVANNAHQSQRIDGEAVFFSESRDGVEADWGPTPNREYWALLSGILEIQTSDGSRREFRPGDVILFEDSNGKGHLVRPVDGSQCAWLTIPLPDQEKSGVDAVGKDSFPASDPPAWTGSIVT